MIDDRLASRPGFRVCRHAVEADENYACASESLTEHQFAKILVTGHQRALIMAGRSEHLGIEGTGPSFRKIHDVETGGSKRLDYGLVDALVGNKSFHAAGRGYTTSAFSARAPNSMAASTASRVRRGCAANNCSIDSPAPSFSRMPSTVSRVPPITGLPIITAGLLSISGFMRLPGCFPRVSRPPAPECTGTQFPVRWGRKVLTFPRPGTVDPELSDLLIRWSLVQFQPGEPYKQ